MNQIVPGRKVYIPAKELDAHKPLALKAGFLARARMSAKRISHAAETPARKRTGSEMILTASGFCNSKARILVRVPSKSPYYSTERQSSPSSVVI